MSEVFDTSQWITFFTRAGLPPNVAANYALIFSDNRIQTNMLMDLSKEYLYDMGIKVMGDVIAILKYAKEFHTQLAKERVIGATSSGLNKSAVAERMVGHYTRPSRASPNRLPMPRNDQKIVKNSTIISLKRPAEDVSTAKKIRRVPPEEEGAYKIKMPLGTTAKTRKILKKKELQSLGKKSVFARLGDSAVSSSTDTTAKTTSSVFERLGASNKNCDSVSTSTVVGETKKKNGAPLQYQGVLKMTTPLKTVPRIRDLGPLTCRTVFKPGTGLKATLISSNYKGYQALLDTAEAMRKKHAMPSQGILGKQRPAPRRSGIKDRLGKQIRMPNERRIVPTSRENVFKIQSVFSRLGR